MPYGVPEPGDENWVMMTGQSGRLYLSITSKAGMTIVWNTKDIST
jgi:hypothetical protein